MTQQSSASSMSRNSTVSSVGSIPDFPIPVAVPAAIPVPAPVVAVPPPRRSVNLGPPPSARRGASSFYSNASYVSPIPEESPRSRSHASFASSAAMPDNWGSTSSLAMSPNYADATSFYEDIPEESRESSNASGYGDEDGSRSGAGSADGDRDADEKHLVRSASIGKRGKAALVTTGARGDSNSGTSPFREGTSYLDASSSSSAITAQTNKATAGSSLTADSILDAYDAATATDPSNPSRRLSVSPQPAFDFGGPARPYNRLSAIRRPPRLDLEAVRKAEARGSLTSLPDLIRRATRLAASLDKGRRPASRIDDLNMSPGVDGRGIRGSEVDTEKHQSGLSDMLAAFPPPAQANRRSFRQSLREQVGSWPLPLNINNIGNSRFSGRPMDAESISDLTDLKNQRNGKGRRCCGLPLWGFVLVVIVVLIIIAAAVVIPLEFFVIRKQNNSGNTSALAKCQSQITCANGGTNVVSTQGVCSCICTNDFTGFDCSVAGDNGCTTTTLTSSAATSSLSDVTLGNALPRLIEQAQQNFSIPLSGTQILAVFNSGNLSCVAENALVTFDGETVRQSSSGSTVVDAFLVNGGDSGLDNISVVDGVAIVTVTVQATGVNAKRGNTILTASGAASANPDQVFPTQSGTTLTISTQITPSIVSPTSTTTVTTTFTPTLTSGGGSGTATSSGSSASASAMFKVTEDVLDFARVAVLFILQQDTLENAELAQSDLQRFFTQASASSLTNGKGVSVDKATNLTLGNSNSINLVQFQVNTANTLRGVGISA